MFYSCVTIVALLPKVIWFTMILWYVGDHVFKKHSSVCPNSCNLQGFCDMLLIRFSENIVNYMTFGTWLNYLKLFFAISPTGRLADRSLVVVVVPNGHLGGLWTKCMFLKKRCSRLGQNHFFRSNWMQKHIFYNWSEKNWKKCSRLGQKQFFQFFSLQQKLLLDLHRKSWIL